LVQLQFALDRRSIVVVVIPSHPCHFTALGNLMADLPIHLDLANGLVNGIPSLVPA